MVDIFKYCPRCGKPAIQTTSPKVINCRKCAFRFYLTAYPTAGAILTNRSGEILLVERKNEPKKGYWDIPGGFVELNENLETAIVRELKEELGADIHGLTYIGSSTDVYPYKGVTYKTITAVYTASISAKIYPADDVASYRYFNVKNFPTKRFAFPGLARLVLKFLGNHR